MAHNATEQFWLDQMNAADAAPDKPILQEVPKASLSERAAARSAARRISSAQTQQAPNPKQAGHAIAKLADSRTKQRQAAAFELMKNARKSGITSDLLEQLDAQLKANAQNQENWIFVMLSAKENAAVIRWINANSSRPRQAVELWATILENLRIDTGEIMRTRQELAERVGMKANDLTKLMTELASINAIRKEKAGRSVTYFLNPQIATHLPNKAARAAARDAAGPLLKMMEGGKHD
jgi:hypothetical protein